MRKIVCLTGIAMLMAGVAQADTITTLNFLDLNTALTGNSLIAGLEGSEAATGVAVTGAVSDNNYLYSVTYTGADYDGDSVNDTLTFGVLVEGFSGTTVDAKTLGATAGDTVSNATASPIGSTDEAMVINAQFLWTVEDNLMELGETLKFTIVSASSSVGSVTFDGFDSLFVNERNSGSHQAIIGAGTDSLNGYDFDSNLTIGMDPTENPLYVSSANSDTYEARWGVSDVDFGITVTVIPEPATLGLVTAMGGGLLFIRRLMMM